MAQGVIRRSLWKFFIKIFMVMLISETWILSTSGCAWNDSILTYLSIILFTCIVYKIKLTELRNQRHYLLAGIISLALSLFVVVGVIRLKISGDITISHLPIKIGIVFAGYFLMIVLSMVYIRRLTMKDMFLAIGISGIFAAVFQMQGIISFFSLAGWGLGCLSFFWFIKNPDFSLSVKNGREQIVKFFLSTAFSIFCIAGNWGVWNEAGKKLGTFQMFGCLILSLIVWISLFYMAITTVVEISKSISICSHSSKTLFFRHFVMCMASMVICWMPYFLAWYPGIMSRDSVTQLEQALGVRAYSNHHPWLHTLLIQLCVKVGIRVGGSVNSGVACYTLFSILFMAFCCTCAVMRVRQKGLKVWGCAILWGFYALFPINGVFMVTMWKDIIFGGIIILFLISLDIICEKVKCGISISKYWWIIWGTLSLGVCLLRSNGLYAWIVLVPFFIYYVRKVKEVKKPLLISVMGVLALLFLYKGIIFNIFQVKEPDLIESLSIPAQQIACVIAEEGVISDEDEALLGQIIDVQKAGEKYTFYISDPIKSLVREKDQQEFLKQHKAEYIKLYIRIGLDNPALYVRAFIEQTKGYWYHKVNNWIYYPDGILANDVGAFHYSLLPVKVTDRVVNLLNRTEDFYHKYFSIALSIWLTLFGTGYALMKKKNYLVYLPLLGIVITLLIATPVSAEFRYIYAIFLAIPMLLFGTICEVQQDGGQHKNMQPK